MARRRADQLWSMRQVISQIRAKTETIMSALVTGATGFIGSAVVRRLLTEGRDVRVFVRLGANLENLAGLDVEFAYGDIRDRRAVAAAVTGAKSVFHLAADYRLMARDVGMMYETNVDGTRNLIETAADAGAHRIIHVSTVATVGHRVDGAPADERDQIRGKDVVGAYKKTKLESERLAFDMAFKGAPVVIVNPSTPLGPRDVKPTPTGRMVFEAVRGRIPAFVDTGLNIAHVDDVAQGVLLAERRGAVGQRYILGGEDLCLRQLLEKISAVVGRPPPRLALPRAPLFPIAFAIEAASILFKAEEPLLTIEKLRMAKRTMYFSSEKARRELGYDTRPADEAVHDAVRYFQSRL